MIEHRCPRCGAKAATIGKAIITCPCTHGERRRTSLEPMLMKPLDSNPSPAR